MRKEVKILGAIAIVVVIAAIVGASYYRSSVQNERISTNSNSNKSTANAENLIRPDSATLGAADASVTLVEFYDPDANPARLFIRPSKKF